MLLNLMLGNLLKLLCYTFLSLNQLKDTMTTKQHPYHAVLKWVADGEEIQGLCINNTWSDITSNVALQHVEGLGHNFYFQPNEFRIKPKPHIHQELMDAHKAGADIQFCSRFYKEWDDAIDPAWYTDYEYRIKPQPKPDIIGYCDVDLYNGGVSFGQCSDKRISSDNIKVTFCGKTLKLKAIEMIRGN